MDNRIDDGATEYEKISDNKKSKGKIELPQIVRTAQKRVSR